MDDSLWKQISIFLAEFFYIIIAVFFLMLGVQAIKRIKNYKRFTTGVFWFILAFTFSAGPHLPKWVTGICIIVLAIITAIKGVVSVGFQVPDAEFTRKEANRLGFKIFIPAFILAIGAFIVATVFAKLGANNAIGISAIIGLIAALVITNAKPSEALEGGLRLLDNVGTTGILPQLLAALGALFTVAGVGAVIAGYVAMVIPEGSRLIASAVYCIGMALFTIIMGNGFAAFSVITVGIGIPFLINNGASPVVVGALGLTAAYCGTLLTPMAANFNIMPAALLETKDKYVIIKAQAPIAISLLIAHIALIYFFAF